MSSTIDKNEASFCVKMCTYHGAVVVHLVLMRNCWSAVRKANKSELNDERCSPEERINVGRRDFIVESMDQARLETKADTPGPEVRKWK